MFSIPFLDLPPLTSAAGTVRLPGSKSISNRVLLLAALCEGTTLVRDLLASDDTQVMLDALRTLGCAVEPEGEAVRITGLGGRLATREADIFLGNSGTSTRSLTAALAVLAAAQGGRFEIRGVPRMHERPIGDLVDALRPLGCPIEHLGQDGYPPLRLGDGHAHPLQLDAPIRVRGNVSSQFLTGLLQALCLVAEDRDVAIEVIGELISQPYIAITLNLLQRFGVTVRNEGWQRFVIPAGSRLRSPGEIHVEGDASSASYFIALGAIAARPAEPVRIEGVGQDSIQGDVRFIDAAVAMGAQVRSGPNWIEVSRGRWPLKAIDLDCNHIPDAAMTLAVMALYAPGTTRLTNIASWRVKETDRIAAMAAELRKVGAIVVEGADFGHDRFVIHVLLLEFVHDLPRNVALRIGVREDDRSILRPHVVALSVELRRIVDRKKYLEDLAVADLPGVELNLDHFGVTRPAVAHLLVARTRDVAARIPRFDGNDAVEIDINRFQTPETTSAQRSGFHRLSHDCLPVDERLRFGVFAHKRILKA